jgi:hypothetical protein
LGALDADRNGSVEREEFLEWVLQGLSRPKRARAIFASYSPFHKRMESFLRAVERLAMQDAGMPVEPEAVAPGVLTASDEAAVDSWARPGSQEQMAEAAAGGEGGLFRGTEAG